MTRLQGWLLGYCAVATTAIAVLAVLRATDGGHAAFTVVDVERIDVREPDGTLRMVLISGHRLPGIVHQGVEIPHPNRTGAGAIF